MYHPVKHGSWWWSLVAQWVRSLPALWESCVWSLGWEDPLEKEVATHSSILAWRIPWTEKPGGLQSMGSQRAGHDWVTDTFKVWLYHAFNWKGDIRKKTKTKTQDIVSYKKHSLDLDWLDWMQIVLVIYIKLAVQLDSYLEASVGQWQHIYSVATAIPCHGIYHHVGGETWAP